MRPSVMHVRVLLFAQLRERWKGGEGLFALPAGACVRDLLARLRADGVLEAALEARVAVAIGREYVGRDCRLSDGDEVAVLPPVSGGAQ